MLFSLCGEIKMALNIAFSSEISVSAHRRILIALATESIKTGIRTTAAAAAAAGV